MVFVCRSMRPSVELMAMTRCRDWLAVEPVWAVEEAFVVAEAVEAVCAVEVTDSVAVLIAVAEEDSVESDAVVSPR